MRSESDEGEPKHESSDAEHGRRRLLSAAAASGLLFIALADLVVSSDTPALDIAIRDLAARYTPEPVDMAFMPMEWLGYPGAYLPMAMAWGWWLRRHGGDGRVIVIAAWGGWIAHRASKMVYSRKRPPGKPRRVQRRSASYPSGHTVGATALCAGAAVALARSGQLERGPALAVGVGVPVAMGLSRIALDRHWASDVAGGWLLGAGVALTCAALAGR